MGKEANAAMKAGWINSNTQCLIEVACQFTFFCIVSLHRSSLKELYCESNKGRKFLLFLLVSLSCASLCDVLFYSCGQ